MEYGNYERNTLDSLLQEAEEAAQKEVDEKKVEHIQADLERIDTAFQAVETIADTFRFFQRPNVIGQTQKGVNQTRLELETIQNDLEREERTTRDEIAKRNNAVQRITVLKEALKHRDQIESRLNGKFFGMFGKPFGCDKHKWTKDEYETALAKAKFDNPKTGGTERQSAINALQSDLERIKDDIKLWAEDNAVEVASIGELQMTSASGTAKGCVLYRVVEAVKAGKLVTIADDGAKVLRCWHDARHIQNILQELKIHSTVAFLPVSIWDMDEKGNVHGRQFTKDLPDFIFE
jgi:hypothetical protein